MTTLRLLDAVGDDLGPIFRSPAKELRVWDALVIAVGHLHVEVRIDP